MRDMIKILTTFQSRNWNFQQSFKSPKSKIQNPKSEVDDENLVGDFDEGGDTTVISATTDLVSLSDELPDLSNALGERNRTYTDTSPLGVNPYRQGLI